VVAPTQKLKYLSNYPKVSHVRNGSQPSLGSVYKPKYVSESLNNSIRHIPNRNVVVANPNQFGNLGDSSLFVASQLNESRLTTKSVKPSVSKTISINDLIALSSKEKKVIAMGKPLHKETLVMKPNGEVETKETETSKILKQLDIEEEKHIQQLKLKTVPKDEASPKSVSRKTLPLEDKSVDQTREEVEGLKQEEETPKQEEEEETSEQEEEQEEVIFEVVEEEENVVVKRNSMMNNSDLNKTKQELIVDELYSNYLKQYASERTEEENSILKGYREEILQGYLKKLAKEEDLNNNKNNFNFKKRENEPEPTDNGQEPESVPNALNDKSHQSLEHNIDNLHEYIQTAKQEGFFEDLIQKSSQQINQVVDNNNNNPSEDSHSQRSLPVSQKQSQKSSIQSSAREISTKKGQLEESPIQSDRNIKYTEQDNTSQKSKSSVHVEEPEPCLLPDAEQPTDQEEYKQIIQIHKKENSSETNSERQLEETEQVQTDKAQSELADDSEKDSQVEERDNPQSEHTHKEEDVKEEEDDVKEEEDVKEDKEEDVKEDDVKEEEDDVKEDKEDDVGEDDDVKEEDDDVKEEDDDVKEEEDDDVKEDDKECQIVQDDVEQSDMNSKQIGKDQSEVVEEQLEVLPVGKVKCETIPEQEVTEIEKQEEDLVVDQEDVACEIVTEQHQVKETIEVVEVSQPVEVAQTNQVIQVQTEPLLSKQQETVDQPTEISQEELQPEVQPVVVDYKHQIEEVEEENLNSLSDNQACFQEMNTIRSHLLQDLRLQKQNTCEVQIEIKPQYVPEKKVQRTLVQQQQQQDEDDEVDIEFSNAFDSKCGESDQLEQSEVIQQIKTDREYPRLRNSVGLSESVVRRRSITVQKIRLKDGTVPTLKLENSKVVQVTPRYDLVNESQLVKSSSQVIPNATSQVFFDKRDTSSPVPLRHRVQSKASQEAYNRYESINEMKPIEFGSSVLMNKNYMTEPVKTTPSTNNRVNLSSLLRLEAEKKVGHFSGDYRANSYMGSSAVQRNSSALKKKFNLTSYKPVTLGEVNKRASFRASKNLQVSAVREQPNVQPQYKSSFNHNPRVMTPLKIDTLVQPGRLPRREQEVSSQEPTRRFVPSTVGQSRGTTTSRTKRRFKI
jgi:hypothetical protein